jgi:hypothetical protein
MRKLALGLFGLGVSSFLGCTAILGSFDVSPTGTASGDGGGADGTSEASIGDAGDADAFDPSVYLLSCSVDETKAHTVDQSPGGYSRNPFKVFRLTPDTLRVIVQRNPVSPPGPTFSVVTFNTQNNSVQPQVLNGPSIAGQVLDVQRIPGGIGIMTFDYLAANPNSGSLQLWTVSDGAGINAAPTALSAQVAIANPNNTRFSGRLVVMGADDYFFGLSYPSGSSQVWGVGRKSGSVGAPPDLTTTTHTVASFTGTGGVSDMQGAFHVGSNVYLFDGAGPEGTTVTGTTYYPVPDNAATGGTIPGKALTPAGGKAQVALAAAGDPSALSLAVGEIDLSASAMTPLILRAGRVTGAKLTGFTGTDVPVIATYTGLADLPFSNDGPATQFLTSDDLVGVGSGPAAGTKGLGFLWYNVSLGAMRARNVGMTRLLPTRQVDSALVIDRGALSTVAVTFDLVWTETQTSPAQVMNTAQMTCFKN